MAGKTSQKECDIKETASSEKKIVKIEELIPDTNIIEFSGPIFPGIAEQWREFLDKIENKKENVLVLFCTCGGSPDEAFRMMRLLQYRYKTIEVAIFGECYSAGTLFALGANKIHMTDNAQLGPLDVQISKEDDLARMSGECYRQALRNMSTTAALIFLDHLLAIKTNRTIPISTATASRAATEITIGLISPITSQIEPAKLGEILRAQNIGASYGCRLMKAYSQEKARYIVNQLAGGYPSHSTVIDFLEAKKLGLIVEYIPENPTLSKVLAPFEKDLRQQANSPQYKFLDDCKLEKSEQMGYIMSGEQEEATI